MHVGISTCMSGHLQVLGNMHEPHMYSQVLLDTLGHATDLEKLQTIKMNVRCKVHMHIECKHAHT